MNPTTSPEKTDSRQRILQAAVQLFASKGYAATGVREIAGEAGVNLAMVSYFFGSKTGLLEEILREFFEPLTGLTRRHLSQAGDPEEKLRNYIHHLVRYFAEHKEALMVFLLELPRDQPETLELKAHYMGQLVDIYVKSFFEPLFALSGRTLPVAIVGPALNGMILSHFQMRPLTLKVRPAEVQDLDWDHYADLISEIYFNGLNGLLARLPEAEQTK